jgi:hypothetical protein
MDEWEERGEMHALLSPTQLLDPNVGGFHKNEGKGMLVA